MQIIKTKLVRDSDGTRFNPVSAFTRFGCWPHGRRIPIAIIRFVACGIVIITTLVDAGIVDRPTHAEHQPNDGDLLPFILRSVEWIALWTIALLITLVIAGDFKRVDSEMESNHDAAYLWIWNSLVALPPLAWTHLIVYNQFLRWDASNDKWYETRHTTVFTILTLELLYGAWPASLKDVRFPTLLGLVFLAYTAFMDKVFDYDMYVQLDWKRRPETAGRNALVFMIILILCSFACTGIVMTRNYILDRKLGIKYTAVTTQHELASLNSHP